MEAIVVEKVRESKNKQIRIGVTVVRGCATQTNNLRIEESSIPTLIKLLTDLQEEVTNER